MSWRLFRYVLADFLIILGCCVGAFLILFLFASLVDDLGDFIENGAPTGQIVRYFALLQPRYLGQVMPMALLLSSIWVISRMCRHNELTAIRASGSSLLQAAAPILAAGLVFTLLQAWVSEYVAPASSLQAERLRARLISGSSDTEMRTYLAYRNRPARRDWLFRDFNPDETCQGILITQFRDSGLIDWELRAAEATYRDGQWVFHDAVVTRFDADGHFPVEPPRTYDRLTTPHAETQLPALDENPTRLDYLFKLRIVDTLAVPTLWRILREPRELISPPTRAVLKTYLVYRLAFPVSCLLAVLIGIPMAVNYSRGGALRSVLVAIVIMVVFYVCSEGLLAFGKLGLLPPILAGALPSLGFTALGLYLFRRKL